MDSEGSQFLTRKDLLGSLRMSVALNGLRSGMAIGIFSAGVGAAAGLGLKYALGATSLAALGCLSLGTAMPLLADFYTPKTLYRDIRAKLGKDEIFAQKFGPREIPKIAKQTTQRIIFTSKSLGVVFGASTSKMLSELFF